jgi:hypothetical protein
MFRAVVFGLVAIIIVGLVMYTFVWTRKHEDEVKGGLSRSDAREGRKLLDDAARLLSGLGVGMDVDDIDILTPKTRTAVDSWIERYEEYGKGIERA